MRSVTHLVLLPFTFFVSIPALFIKQNIAEIGRLDLAAFPILGIIAIVSIGILLSINVLTKKIHINSIFAVITEFICFFTIFAGFVFPISVSSGMVEVEKIAVHSFNLFLALFFAGAFMMLSIARPKSRSAIYAGLIIFVLSNTIISAFVIWSKFKEEQVSQSLFEVSENKNIFVLSFDGISGSAAEEVLQENDWLSARFGGFKVFNQVAATSPATSASIVTSLYGNKNYKLLHKTIEEVWNSSPDDLLTNFLNDSGYLVSTSDIYGYKFKEVRRTHDFIMQRGLGLTWRGLGAFEIINFAIVRTFSRHFVLERKTIKTFERLVHPEVEISGTDESIMLQKIDSAGTPYWKKQLARTIIDLEMYIRELKVGTPKPVAHFLHFTFTHYPVEFDRNCQYRGDNLQWVESRQNRFGVKEETLCALIKFSEFIQKLKNLDVFNQSMIILKSDHGKPVRYYNTDSIQAETIHEHPSWGFGRYEPFLAIKDFANTSNEIEKSSQPVLLDDLAKTICVAAIGDGRCERYPGYNVLEDNLVIPETATATLFVVQSKKSDFQYGSLKAVTVKRQPNVLLNLWCELAVDENSDLISNRECK